jgi:hypothetical protein
LTPPDTRSSGSVRYWIDDFGRLWKGPVAADENLHYATLDGVRSDGSPCWVLRRSSPGHDWEEIGEAKAAKVIALFLEDHNR